MGNEKLKSNNGELKAQLDALKEELEREKKEHRVTQNQITSQVVGQRNAEMDEEKVMKEEEEYEFESEKMSLIEGDHMKRKRRTPPKSHTVEDDQSCVCFGVGMW